MPVTPIITFKAGRCDVEDTTSRPLKVKPQPQPGYLYLYSEDDLIHFCWRKRAQSLDEPELDLVMVPTDGSFVPYQHDPTKPNSKTDGRIFVLKFASSSQRYLFWMQSKPQSRNGDPAWLSPRDRKIGEIVHQLLQGEEVNVVSELASVRNVDDRRDDDDDEIMEDAEGQSGPPPHHGSGSGGAGPGATGGDIREEGEESREGGADGARAASSAAPNAADAVRDFLESLRGQQGLAAGQQPEQPEQEQQEQVGDMPYPSLNHLLPTSVTIPVVDEASSEYIDNLLNYLPSAAIMSADTSVAASDNQNDPSAAVPGAIKNSISLDDKRLLVKKVLRSPQFNHALATLTLALRDGGLPGIAEALGVHVKNAGYMQGNQMPLGGSQAVKAFVDGVRKTVKGSRQDASLEPALRQNES